MADKSRVILTVATKPERKLPITDPIGKLSDEDAELILRVIEDECEQVP